MRKEFLKNMDKIAVLIPCYNEAQTIEKVVTDFKNALPEAVIYVFDNNSTDDTIEKAKKAGAVVYSEHRQGKGNVIRTMFRQIDAECYLMIDGDDTYPCENAKQMCNLVLNDNIDMVIGDRLSSTYFTENKRQFHNFGNVIVRKLVNGIFGGDVADIMTGYRAFSSLFAKSFPVLSKGFEIETEMTIHALDKNLALKSVPVLYRDRPQGSVSKLNTVSDGSKVLFTIFKLYKDYKPLSFFSLISLLFVSTGLVFFIPIFIEFLNTGLVPKIPTLVVCCFMWLSGLLSFCCGCILDTVVKKDRQSFELNLNLISKLFKK